MKRNFIFILVILILISQLSFSESRKLDSLTLLINEESSDSILFDTYISIGKVYSDSNLLQSRFYYMQSLNYTNTLQNKIPVGKTYMELGNILTKLGEYAKALAYFNMSANLFDSISVDTFDSWIDLKVGNVLWFQEEYDQALYYYQQSYKKALFVNDLLVANYALGNISICYQEMGRYEEALQILNTKLQKSIEYCLDDQG